MEGKGQGVVATRDIEAGELVLKEFPLVVHSSRTSFDGLENAVSALSNADKDDYNSLYVNPSLLSWLPRPLAIFKTNAIQLAGPQGIKGGLFVKGSRFNHSCLPNCSRFWDEKQGVEWFIANRSIKKGEEVCITYGEIREAKLERQEWLKRSLGFDCGCEACSAPEGETSTSDWRRLKIKQIDDLTDKLQPRPLELIKEVNNALKLLEEEGLVVGAFDLANEALMICAWYGDRLNASRWIDKASELLEKESGISSTQYKEVEGWKGDPTLHPAWNDACRKKRIPSKVLAGPE